MNVINIRGTTGSGKTSIVRKLMKDHDFSPPITITKGAVAHFSDKYVIIGPYLDGSNFGGIDAVKKISYVEPAILKAMELRPTVFFEGLLISHSYERWLEFSKKLANLQKKKKCPPVGMIWAFITPPFGVNIERLKKRNKIPSNKTLREVKGDAYIKNFIGRYKSICRIKLKAKVDMGMGHLTMRELDYIKPYEDLKKILESDLMNNYFGKK